MNKTKLKRDDTVQIIAGKDTGKSGKILKIDTDSNRVIVQGLNMVKKAVKPKRQNEKGGIIDIEAALSISNLMIVCRKCGPTRIGIDFDSNTGERKRICRKCKEVL